MGQLTPSPLDSINRWISNVFLTPLKISRFSAILVQLVDISYFVTHQLTTVPLSSMITLDTNHRVTTSLAKSASIYTVRSRCVDDPIISASPFTE